MALVAVCPLACARNVCTIRGVSGVPQAPAAATAAAAATVAAATVVAATVAAATCCAALHECDTLDCPDSTSLWLRVNRVG